MSFTSRITRSPRPYDPDQGADARALFSGFSNELKDLIAGTAGCSPYLGGLITREKDWLSEALEAPEEAFEAVLENCAHQDIEILSQNLRQAKRRVALLIGLADLAGVWSLSEATTRLTRFADHATDLALRAAIAAEIRRGKLPGKTEEHIETAGGMVVLAMGKMGAFELNYSSDIDLICLFDETQFDPDDFHDARASFVRATRKMSGLLNDKTPEGYVFRTDLRLRPDPAVTPVCMAMEAAERYYESLGRTWERAAYIKARPAAGDRAAGDRFLAALTPFVWRKHLDFAAIEDAHNMRLRIREHKGLGGAVSLPGHNMKLGRGGIREIEFFTQTRQLIAGGRDPDLRTRGTVEGLARLAAKGWVPEDVTETLPENSQFQREVAHRLQMLRDAQTHSLPNSEDEFDRLAAFMGRDNDALTEELLDRINSVHGLIEAFFAPQGEVETSPESAMPEGLEAEVIARWPSYPALRSSRAMAIFGRLRPDILNRLSKSSNPKDALLAFDAFLAGLPAGVQLFSLFEANPQLIDLLVDIVGTSHILAEYLSRNAGVFDAVIAGDFFAPWPGQEVLIEGLTRAISGFEDYERILDRIRRWKKEWHFRVGVHHLRGLIDAPVAAAHYAELADVVLTVLTPVVVSEFARKYGPPPGRGAAILGMGSLGSARLTSQSDLDLIVIYDPAGVEGSDGPRALATRPYYTRLTQAFITALTAPMSEGRLYEVDMRLRPSGTQGPVATSWASFQDYQSNQAWTWEHLALTRARVITGAPDLMADIEGFRRSLLEQKSDPTKVTHDVAEMRTRIAGAKSPSGAWDVKLGAGRLQDIELIAQAGCLIAGSTEGDIIKGLDSGVGAGWLDAADRQDLATAYRLCWQIQMVARQLNGTGFDPSQIGEGGQAFLLRETGRSDLQGLLEDLQN